jgi:hypothetical protein
MSEEKNKIYQCWAPEEGRWSRWVKPVLFANIEGVFTYLLPRPPRWTEDELFSAVHSIVGSRAMSAYRDTDPPKDLAIVVDLPGIESLMAGIALVKIGFRPVPLYNSLPAEEAVIEMRPLVEMLAAPPTSLDRLPRDAPPAFLLDQRRQGEGALIDRSILDNRSSCSTADFPTAQGMLVAGILRVLVIHSDGRVASDLEQVIHAWRDAGLDLFVTQPGVAVSDPLKPIAPSGMWQRIVKWCFEPPFDSPSSS